MKLPDKVIEAAADFLVEKWDIHLIDTQIEGFLDDVRGMLAAALAAIADTHAVVPRMATDAMIDAGCAAINGCFDADPSTCYQPIWTAMIAAAEKERP